mmetsp:Transcript_36737/g.79295  ORF Transcript_36737/g.79295 Transcript_36737/m.79295 type:complete len:110 (-) Transcript_36737:1104-1433(-)
MSGILYKYQYQPTHTKLRRHQPSPALISLRNHPGVTAAIIKSKLIKQCRRANGINISSSLHGSSWPIKYLSFRSLIHSLRTLFDPIHRANVSDDIMTMTIRHDHFLHQE